MLQSKTIPSEIDIGITDYAMGLLLRYFRSPEIATINRPYIEIQRDREILRLHWAISPVLQNLISYVVEHRHEIQSTLKTTVRYEDGIVRGKLDAVATLKLRRMSGLATAVVSHEPLRTHESGPNHVLGWVIAQAWSLSSHFKQVELNSLSYRARIDEILGGIERVKRIQSVAQISSQINIARRPTSRALLEATRSRREIYRRAALAYKELVGVEAGDIDTISNILRHTLLAPLEPWRRFELATAYAVADALSQEEHSALQLGTFIGSVKHPVAKAGRFAIYWQWRTDAYVKPIPEQSEIVMERLQDVWGLPSSSDRPDLIVLDQKKNQVVAIIEVKYLTGEDASDRIRGAFSQVVRYARGYRAIEDVGELLGKCLIAVSQGLEAITPPNPLPSDVPSVVDFEGIRHTSLQEWTRRLVSA